MLQFVAPVLRTVFRILSLGVDILKLVSRFVKAVIDTIAQHVDFSGFTDGIREIMRSIGEFVNLGKFQEKFTSFIDGIKAALDTNDFPFLEGLGDAIENIKDVLGRSAGFIVDKATIIGDALKKHLGRAFEKFSEIISTYWPIIKKKFEEFREFASEKFARAMEILRGAIEFAAPIVKEQLAAIRDSFADFMASGRLEKFAEAFGGLFGDVVGLLQTTGQGFGDSLRDIFAKIREALSDKTMNAMDRLTEAMSGLRKGLSDNGPIITEKLGGVKDAILRFFEKIAEVLGGPNGSAVMNFIGILFGLLLVKKLLGTLNDIKEGGPKNPFAETLDAINGAIEQTQKTIKSVSIVAIATAFLELAAAMVKLSEIDNRKVIAVCLAMVVMTKILESMMDSLKSIDSANPGQLISAGIAVMLMAGAMSILANAVLKL